MKICYIIKTCEKYLENRAVYQANSFIKDIDINDIYYLTSKSDISKRHFGWNTNDSYEYLTWKIINFFYNINIDNYDWYFFIDDDTFVFVNRLKKFLKKLDTKTNYYIGKELVHMKDVLSSYMSGGSGYIMSNSLFILLNKYIKQKGLDFSYIHWCEDLNTGLLIQDLSKNNSIIQLNNDNFYTRKHLDEQELIDAITFHKVITKEDFDFYNAIYQEDKKKEHTTIFSLITDKSYFHKAHVTINDLRTSGGWSGDIVLITIDFHLDELDENYKQKYNITEAKFPLIDKTMLLEKIGPNGFINSDKRELHKLNQWEKLHIFDDYFSKWNRVVYLDAGLRVLDDVKYLLELDYKDKILAPNDASPNFNPDQIFKFQLDWAKPELIDLIVNEIASGDGDKMFNSRHMLNCMWVYDTSILKICNKTQLIEAMNKYTLCRTNEMGIMNLLFHFKYKLWREFPLKNSDGKYLFEWCELNHNFHTTWKDYCFIKYPISISLNQPPY